MIQGVQSTLCYSPLLWLGDNLLLDLLYCTFMKLKLFLGLSVLRSDNTYNNIEKSLPSLSNQVPRQKESIDFLQYIFICRFIDGSVP